jgi:hypothetical protein
MMRERLCPYIRSLMQNAYLVAILLLAQWFMNSRRIQTAAQCAIISLQEQNGPAAIQDRNIREDRP